jgi:WD40 repeat protein
MRRIIREVDPVRPSTRLSTLSMKDAAELVKHRREKIPTLIDLVRGDLDWIVMKCLEKDRARRYETANGVAMDLQRHLNNEPVVARPPSTAYRFQKLVRRNKLVFAAGAAVAAALVIGLGVSTVAFFRQAEARRRAVAAEQAEAVERQRAEGERNLARTEARRAEAARAQTEQANLSLELERAELLFAQGRAANALGSLARLLRTQPTNRIVAERLLSALSLRNICLPVAEPFLVGEEFQYARFLPDGRLAGIVRTNLRAGPFDVRTGRQLLPDRPAETVGMPAGVSMDFTRAFLVTGDNEATVWDLATLKKLHTLPHDRPPRFGLFNARNTHLVTSDGATVWLWNLGSGRLESGPMPLPQRGVVRDISADGQRLLAIVSRENVAVLDLRTGESLSVPTKHQRRIVDVAFSPDGERFVTASMDSTARLWDARTGRSLCEPLRHDHYVQTAQFSPDGMTLVTASRDNSVRLWDAFSGVPVTDRLEHDSDVNHAVVSGDGRQVLTLSRKKAWVWDLRRGEPLALEFPHSNEVAVVHFSRDGARVLTASDDGTARVWDTRTGRPLTASMTHRSWVQAACFSPDERLVATASPDGTARVWDARTGEPITPPLRHESDVRTAHFSPDGTRVLTASHDNTARVWDARTGEELLRIEHRADVEHAVFSPDGRRILTAGWDATARLWDANTGEQIGEPLRHDGAVLNALFSPDGSRIVTTSADQTARLWDAATGKPLAEPIRHSDELRHRTPAFSADGTKVVSVARNEAKVWDGHTGRLLIPPLMHSHRVYSAQFSRDGTRVVTTTSDGTARIWDTASGLQVSEPLRHGGKVNSAEFSSDGRWLLTASADGRARLWEVLSMPVAAPVWLADLAEALAGQRINAEGGIEPVAAERLVDIKRTATSGDSTNPFTQWARWFFAESATRTLSPSSLFTMMDYVQRRLEENTVESAREAVLLAPANAGAAARLAELLIADSTNVASLREADWWSRRALDLAPGDARIESLRRRVEQCLAGETK